MGSSVTQTKHRHRWSQGLLLLTALLFICPPTPAFDADDTLTLGVFPRRPAATTQRMFAPITAQLTALAGVQIQLDTPPDFSSFWQRLSNGRYQLVHLNQYQYLRAHAEHGFDAIAMNEEFGSDRIASVIWVNEDSPIDSLTGLRGKTLLLGGGRDAMMASIVPRYLLMQAGLPTGSYLVRSTLHPVKAVVALAFRQGDAVGSGEVVPQLPTVRAKLGDRRLRALARSAPLAHLPWATSRTITPADARTLGDALQRLNNTPAGKAALKAASLTGLHPASDDDYAPHRDIVLQVLGEDYR